MTLWMLLLLFVEVDGFDGNAIFSRHTGHWCSSIACCCVQFDDAVAIGAAISSLDVNDAKKGPSKLTPFSPSTWTTR